MIRIPPAQKKANFALSTTAIMEGSSAAYSRIRGPNKQPPESTLYRLATHGARHQVGTYDAVLEGAEGKPIQFNDTKEPYSPQFLESDRILHSKCIQSGITVGNGVCVLRGGCIAVAEKFDGSVIIVNPVTGAWMVLADGLDSPGGVIQAPDTSLIVCCWSHIVRIKLTGEVALLCGDEDERGFDDGEAADARFNNMNCVVLNHANTGVLVNDRFNYAIRSVLWNGTVETVVSSDASHYGMVNSIAACPDGSYLFDGKHKIMKLAADGSVTTVVGNGAKPPPPNYIGVDGVGEDATFMDINSLRISSNNIAMCISSWHDTHLRIIDLKTSAVQTLEYSAPGWQCTEDGLTPLSWQDVNISIQNDGTLLIQTNGEQEADLEDQVTIMFKLELNNIPNIGSPYSTFKGWGAPWLKPNRACISMCSPKVTVFMSTILHVAARAMLRTGASIGRRSTRATKHWRSLVLPIELWYYIIEMVLPPPCSALP